VGSKDGKDRVCISYRPTEREEMADWRSEGDMLRDAWYWRRARSNPPPGCLCRLWRSASTLTEPIRLVLATVPGYLAAVQVWNRTGWCSLGCFPENRGTQRVRGRVGTGPRFHITVPASLPPIEYLRSDRIVTWSVRKSCSFGPSFTSRCQICDWANIRWIAVK